MEATSPVRHGPNITNVLFMLLLIALALGAVLAFMVFKPSGSGPVFAVTAINANPCPSGEGAPACFQVLVENTGTEAANVRCELTAAEGTTAVFLSGETVYASAASIKPQTSIPLSVKVDVSPGNDTVVSPSVACGQVPA
jgi:hypothetical protein